MFSRFARIMEKSMLVILTKGHSLVRGELTRAQLSCS